MTDAHPDVDAPALESYLTRELGNEVTGTAVLADGLNLIVSVSTAEAEYVLRRPNDIREASYMNDIREEYGVMRRLRDTPVDAPDPVLFCEDDSLVGDEFFVMTRLGGAEVPLGSDLPERFRDPASRRRVAERLVDALAELHSVDPDPFEAVCNRLTPREEVERSLDQLDRATSVTGHEVPTLRSVGEWLLENAPHDPDEALVHGDFRPGNVLFADAPEPAITGILDWETAMLGDPLTELGYLLLRWRDEGDPRPSVEDLEARYSDEAAIEDLRETNAAGLAPFTAKPGSPSRRELVDRYEARTGTTFEHERFHRAKAAFGFAVVWEDLHRYRVEAGEESDWEPYVDYMARLADSIARGDLTL